MVHRGSFLCDICTIIFDTKCCVLLALTKECIAPRSVVVCSRCVQVIQDAIKNKSPNVDLLGRSINVDPNSGIFITMNPAGKGYGGRQKLPDNLKALFRPVAMSRPDNELISEVILFSEGFKEAKSLGRKLVAIFNLSK